MTVAIALLSLIVGLGLGFYARQVWNKLVVIEAAIRQIRSRQEEPPKLKVMTYVEPIDLNTVSDEDRIAYLNR